MPTSDARSRESGGHRIEVFSDPAGTATAGEAFVLVTARGGRLVAGGHPCVELGHRLPSAAHPIDDGVFARWHWDGARLVVSNDRYGFYPLFWFRPPGGGVCVSPSLLRLIEQGAPTELDIEALSVFLRLGFFVGEDTPFSSIKAVPPNAAFVWQSNELECHARYPQAPAASAISRGEAIDHYIALFARAMSRRTSSAGAFAVPISGGRDSRHILLELHRTGVQPAVCVSANDNPPDPNVDPEVGKLLCEELGFRHIVIDQQLSLLSAQLRKNRETHFCASAHGWYLALADFLNGHYDCVYDGIAGDVLSQSSFLDAGLDTIFRTTDPRTMSSELLARHGKSRAALGKILNGQLRRAVDPGLAVGRLSREIEKHLDVPSPIASFIFWNRTRRATALAPYSLLAGTSCVFAPFLDHDVFDFMSTLPAGMLMDRTFHTDAIARAYPAFAHIPYADNKGAPRTDDTYVKRRFLMETGGRILLRRPSSLMKNMMPRAKILAGLLSGGLLKPFVSPLIIYLDQIESIVNRYG